MAGKLNSVHRETALSAYHGKGRSQILDRRVHEVGNDVRARSEAPIARDIGDGELGQFKLRKHCNLHRNSRNSAAG